MYRRYARYSCPATHLQYTFFAIIFSYSVSVRAGYIYNVNDILYYSGELCTRVLRKRSIKNESAEFFNGAILAARQTIKFNALQKNDIPPRQLDVYICMYTNVPTCYFILTNYILSLLCAGVGCVRRVHIFTRPE